MFSFLTFSVSRMSARRRDFVWIKLFNQIIFFYLFVTAVTMRNQSNTRRHSKLNSFVLLPNLVPGIVLRKINILDNKLLIILSLLFACFPCCLHSKYSNYREELWWRLKFRCGLVKGFRGSPILASSFFFCAFQRHVKSSRKVLATVVEIRTPSGIIHMPQFSSTTVISFSVMDSNCVI